MFGMGMGELLLIMVVALLVVGPDKLPQAAKAIGKGIRDFRRHSQDLQSTLEQDEKLGEAVRELRSALRDDPFRALRQPIRTPFSPSEPSSSLPTSTAAAAGAASASSEGSATGSAADVASPGPSEGAAPSSSGTALPQPPAIIPASGTVAKQAAEVRPAVAGTRPRGDDPAHG